MSLAREKCGGDWDVQLPREDGTFMTAARYMALHKVAGMVLRPVLRDVCTRRIIQTWRVTSWQFSHTSRDRPAVADRQPDALTCAGPRRPRGLVTLIDYAHCGRVGEDELSRKQSRNFTTSRRRLHEVVGVLRRSGWRLNAKMAERPSGNL
jgi:hypothetical protein